MYCNLAILPLLQKKPGIGPEKFHGTGPEIFHADDEAVQRAITVLSLIGHFLRARNIQSETRCDPVRVESSVRNFSRLITVLRAR